MVNYQRQVMMDIVQIPVQILVMRTSWMTAVPKRKLKGKVLWWYWHRLKPDFDITVWTISISLIVQPTTHRAKKVCSACSDTEDAVKVSRMARAAHERRAQAKPRRDVGSESSSRINWRTWFLRLCLRSSLVCCPCHPINFDGILFPSKRKNSLYFIIKV